MKGRSFLGGTLGVVGLVALAVGIIVFINFRSNSDKNRPYLYAGLATGAGATLLLNSLGIWAGFKTLGGLGMAISAVMIAYGIYAVVTKNALIGGVSADDTVFIGSIFIAVGAMTIVSSLGIIASM